VQTRFSSTHHWFFLRERFLYTAAFFQARDYLSQRRNAPHFFPPRLQIVGFSKTGWLPATRGTTCASLLLHQQAHRPTRRPSVVYCKQGNDALRCWSSSNRGSRGAHRTRPALSPLAIMLLTSHTSWASIRYWRPPYECLPSQCLKAMARATVYLTRLHPPPNKRFNCCCSALDNWTLNPFASFMPSYKTKYILCKYLIVYIYTVTVLVS